MSAFIPSEVQETSLILQGDAVHYEQAYSLNNFDFLCSVELSEIISAVMIEIVKKTDRLASPFASPFQAKSQPRVSIQVYLHRLLEKFRCSQECLILAMIYIDRFTENQPRFVMKTTNIYRLMMTAIVVAAKFLDDHCYKNSYYARAAGVSLQEMNELEGELLNAIDFNCHVHPVLFFRYRESLLSQGRPLLRLQSSQ